MALAVRALAAARGLRLPSRPSPSRPCSHTQLARKDITRVATHLRNLFVRLDFFAPSYVSWSRLCAELRRFLVSPLRCPLARSRS